ncbi:hypothetical protein AB0383_20570 [Amycolatopsis sp. NPDC051373]|uniref:hypothetical protein n=1 Tax=Amycolatopsis sp. NPDC051373 TaxID=3155801 RepID=UPI00344D905D
MVLQQHDLLVQLAVVERRIDWALDRHDPRMFAISCQHRAQIKSRLLALAADVATEIEAA